MRWSKEAKAKADAMRNQALTSELGRTLTAEGWRFYYGPDGTSWELEDEELRIRNANLRCRVLLSWDDDAAPGVPLTLSAGPVVLGAYLADDGAPMMLRRFPTARAALAHLATRQIA